MTSDTNATSSRSCIAQTCQKSPNIHIIHFYSYLSIFFHIISIFILPLLKHPVANAFCTVGPSRRSPSQITWHLDIPRIPAPNGQLLHLPQSPAALVASASRKLVFLPSENQVLQVGSMGSMNRFFSSVTHLCIHGAARPHDPHVA